MDDLGLPHLWKLSYGFIWSYYIIYIYIMLYIYIIDIYLCILTIG